MTYDEFAGAVRKLDPHLNTHNINKMFREAYKGSDSFAMTETAFLSVCKNYGLVRLLDLAKVQSFRPNASPSYSPVVSARNSLTDRQ